MTEEEVKREMLLRMIIRCRKSKSRRIKKVKISALTVEKSYSSYSFPKEALEKKHYRGWSETREVRNSVRNLSQVL